RRRLPLPSPVDAPERAKLFLPAGLRMPAADVSQHRTAHARVFVPDVGLAEFGMACRRFAMIEAVGMPQALVPQSGDHGVLAASGVAVKEYETVLLSDAQRRILVLVRRAARAPAAAVPLAAESRGDHRRNSHARLAIFRSHAACLRDGTPPRRVTR